MKIKIRNLIVMITFLVSQVSNAAVLWVGGEDIDFPNGGSVCAVGGYRSGYARQAIAACNTNIPAYSNSFPGGAITSGWLAAWIWGADATSHKYVGFARSGQTSSLWIGTSASSNVKLAIWKYDNTTWTEIATETTGSLTYDGQFRVDIELINYGAAGTVNVYTNGGATAKLSYTGNLVAGGATDLDRVGVKGQGNWSAVSEIIVSSTDTRKMSLVTLAPNAAGTTSQWTGTYSNINPSVFSDATNITTNNSGDIFHANLIDLPAGNFQVLAVKETARMTQTGSGLTSVSFGVRTNATDVTPAATPLLTTWGTFENYYLTNPVTATQWLPAEINALQLQFQAAP